MGVIYDTTPPFEVFDLNEPKNPQKLFERALAVLPSAPENWQLRGIGYDPVSDVIVGTYCLGKSQAHKNTRWVRVLPDGTIECKRRSVRLGRGYGDTDRPNWQADCELSNLWL